VCRCAFSRFLFCLALLAAPLGAGARDSEFGDPTRPPTVRPAAVDRAHPLVLSAIYWAPERPAAVIDGRRVGVGADVGAFVVEAIERDAVRLRGAGGFVELRLAARVRRARGEAQ
jgi:hypothetical protein